MKKAKEDLSIGKDTFLLSSKGKISTKYLKLEEIGQGTFSKVFRVQSKSSFKTYICRSILKEKVQDMNKLRNEINILSKCDHPNIIKLYEIFEDSNNLEVIMEECKGGALFDSLESKLDNGETFTEKEAAKIFKELMSAVCYCHNQGICHRDLKPDNILFANKAEDSAIKVIDFGLSKIFGEIKPLVNSKGNKVEKNTMSARVGTAYYISPEVLQGSYDYKCDIWSCGVILYLLLSGEPPFDGESEADIYKAILRKKYSFPEKEWKGISDEAKDLIKHMICDPDKRYNAEGVLNHPWLEKMASNAKNGLQNFNLGNLKKHLKNYKLKKMALYFIAARLGEDEVKELRNVFESLDSNKDGTLTLEEMKNGLTKIQELKGGENLNEDDIINLFKSMDMDNNNRVEYSEFIAAAMEQKSYYRDEKLVEFFDMMDRDGSGKIDKKEIKNFLDKGNCDKDLLEKIIKEFDLDNNGDIDYKEFLSGMKEIEKKEEEAQLEAMKNATITKKGKK